MFFALTLCFCCRFCCAIDTQLKDMLLTILHFRFWHPLQFCFGFNFDLGFDMIIVYLCIFFLRLLSVIFSRLPPLTTLKTNPPTSYLVDPPSNHLVDPPASSQITIIPVVNLSFVF